MATDKKQRALEDWRTGRTETDTLRSETWQGISDYVMPRKSEISTKKTQTVDNYTDNIFDTTAIHANTTLAAGQMDFLVGGKWFNLRPPFQKASEIAKEWYRKAGETMEDVINGSNFDMEVHSFFNMRGAFGTSHFHVEEDEEEVIYCKSEDIGNYVIFENARGFVNKVIVLKKYTPAQLIEEYGEKGKRGNLDVPAKIRERAEKQGRDSQDDKIEVIMWIGPRPDKERQSGAIDALNMPIRTMHIVLPSKDGSDDGHMLRESGYPEMPSMISRWAEWSDSPYGYCPSIEVQSIIRQLNFLEENQDTVAEVKLNPRLLIPSNLEGDVGLRGGGVTIFDEGMPGAKPEEWLTGADMNANQERLIFKRSQINQAYFVDLFQLLTGLDERAREKTGRFHPTFTRLNKEFSKPFLDRVFSICFRAGLFPDPPADVIRQNRVGEAIIDTPKVVFTSKMAMLIKARENNDFAAFQGLAQMLTEMDPDAFRRVVNTDRALKTMAENQGVNSDFLNTEEESAAVAEQQQIQAEQQLALQTAEVAAKAAGNLGSAPDGIQDAITI